MDGKTGVRETSRKTCRNRNALILGVDTKAGNMKKIFRNT